MPVLDRGDSRESIFRDYADRERFLRTMSEVCARTGSRVHAWVLMSNLAALVTQRTGVFMHQMLQLELR